MNTTIGKRIASLRKEKGLSQEELAGMLGLSGQAVSKWENDQTCPDISLLPQLANILEVSVDELLSGKQEIVPLVQILPQDQRKDLKDMILRVSIDSAKGDKVRVNLPLSLVQIAIDTGLELPQISGNNAFDAFKHIDWNQVLAMISQGAIGNLVEVESADGDTVRIFVE